MTTTKTPLRLGRPLDNRQALGRPPALGSSAKRAARGPALWSSPSGGQASGCVVTAPDGQRTVFALPDGNAIPIHAIVQRLPFAQQCDYAQMYAHAWVEALQRQGTAAFDGSKMSAALHEAGHLVVGTLQGVCYCWARIWRVRNPYGRRVWAGWSEGDIPDPAGRSIGTSLPPEANLSCARETMAGYMAERVFEGAAAREGSSLDERIVALMLVAWAAIGACPDKAGRTDAALRMLHETEQTVGEMLAAREAQVRGIAAAIIGAAPYRLQGAKLRRVLHGVAREKGRD